MPARDREAERLDISFKHLSACGMQMEMTGAAQGRGNHRRRLLTCKTRIDTSRNRGVLTDV